VVIGANRPRLYAAMLAAQSLGAIPVPLYQDAVAAECVFPINNAEVRFAIAEDQEQVDKLIEIKARCPRLEKILYDEARGMRHYDQPYLVGLDDVQTREVERLARDAGFVTVRRSELPIDAEPRVDVVVLDTIGELAQLYQVATAVFVGGSLVDQGGHNILEPAVFGKPIVFGPHMHNFKEIAEAFVANDAAIQLFSERELDEALVGLVTDPVRRARLGAAARALVAANRGAKTKTLDVISELLPAGDVERRAVVRPFRRVH